MCLLPDVPTRIAYIQKLFLDIEVKLAAITDLNDVFALLATEPPEYRSIAYESASFALGLTDLTKGGLDRWTAFREASPQHTFHIDIGLGWAFAKTGLYPKTHLATMHRRVAWMVFDGMGYYYGLYKGRNTLKSKLLPGWLEEEDLPGFDEGLGRRLWYTSKGSVTAVSDLAESFAGARQAHLFRGIGIACGYVGGTNEEDLQRLLRLSGKHYTQLQAGVRLAAVSRILSNSITADTHRACAVICGKGVDELKPSVHELLTNNFYLYKAPDIDRWPPLPES